MFIAMKPPKGNLQAGARPRRFSRSDHEELAFEDACFAPDATCLRSKGDAGRGFHDFNVVFH